MKKVIGLFCLIVCMTGFFTSSVQAENFEDDWIQGLVVDQNGEPVIGASIFEKGTQNGTVTDVDGKFKLDVQSYDHTLEISYIGYTTQRIKPKKGDHTAYKTEKGRQSAYCAG